ncbi:MAG: D-2-hydroxyacid dehydrogenase [Bacteroidota bacterium]
MRPKIVVLDGAVVNPGDLSWAKLEELGDLTVYPDSSDHQVPERIRDAQIVLTNKAVLTAETIANAPKLQYIGVIASGYNTVDIHAAAERNIPVTNGLGYGTASVAQHVFAYILHFCNQVALHNQDIQQGGWSKANVWCYSLTPLQELLGKTLGIYGYGRIGQQVGKIARAFGMIVIAHTRSPEKSVDEATQFVDLETLFRKADFLSLHAPLTDENNGLVNTDRLKLMHEGAYLINTGRGGLIKEPDLREALLARQIAGAALDVLTQEPAPDDHPLIGLDRCILTPHNAWASQSSRGRLLDIVMDNVAAFLSGDLKRVVNGVEQIQ